MSAHVVAAARAFEARLDGVPLLKDVPFGPQPCKGSRPMPNRADAAAMLGRWMLVDNIRLLGSKSL